MTIDDMQNAHEAQLRQLLSGFTGKGRQSDWALIRALVHRAVHIAADQKAAEYCAVATLLAEMTIHAHALLHPTNVH